MAVLDGKVLAVLEARRATEMASLIARHGGTVYAAPALKEVPLDNQPQVSEFLGRLIDGPLDYMIFLTGVGTRALLAAAAQAGRLPAVLLALAGTAVVARGPKPAAVLREYSVRIDLAPPEPNTSRELLALLPDSLLGNTVALQHYGEPNVALRRELQRRGATVLEVSLYGWALPDDQAPLERFIRDSQEGAIDAVAATSQAQVHNLFRLANHFGQGEALREVLNRSVAVAAVGPVCAKAWEDWGVRVDIQPEHPKMGHLVLAVGQYYQHDAAKGRAASH